MGTIELIGAIHKLDAVMTAYEELISLPDCNTCKKRDCKHRPKPGAMVRINCFDYDFGFCTDKETKNDKK